MESNRMAVGRNIIILAMNSNDRWQTSPYVIDGRKLFRKLFGITHTSKPLARVIFSIWTFQQINNVADTKPVNNRGDLHLRNCSSIPTLTAFNGTLTIKDIVRRQHASD